MKSILISIKPKWCAKIMNGEKTLEIRTSKALYKAIQTLIDEYGYADIHVYCSRGKHYLVKPQDYDKYLIFTNGAVKSSGETSLNGKVLFKFRCYKVEEIINPYFTKNSFLSPYLIYEDLLKWSCLTEKELDEYINKGQKGYTIHISDLEIFDEPKELTEFYKVGYLEEEYNIQDHIADIIGCDGGINESYVDKLYEELDQEFQLKKAPQNFCYVEEEK